MRSHRTVIVTWPVGLGLLVALGTIFLLAACGGSSPGTAETGQPTPAQTTALATPTEQLALTTPAPATATQESAPATMATATAPPATADTSTTGPQVETEACPVLIKQEVETAIGKPVLNADLLTTEGSLLSCGYRDPESPASILVSVIVASGSQAKLGFDTRKSLADDAQPIEGIGDDAFWVPSESNLEVLKGDDALTLTVNKEATADQKKVAQELAPKILSRLPYWGTGASTPQASTTSPALDVSTLLTKQEVEEAVGKNVLDGVRETAGPLVGYSFKDPNQPIFTVASVSVFVAGSPSEAKEVFEMSRKDAQTQAVEGLGDEAYWRDELHYLEVLKGNYDVTVEVAPDAPNSGLEVTQELAEKVLSRLP